MDADLLIVGGGLSGLSLALRLANTRLRVVVLESRAEYRNDRTWCFWERPHHELESLVSARWPRWSVSLDQETITREARGYTYQQIRSEDFYAHARRALAEAPNVELRLGHEVRRVLPSVTGTVVETDHGTLFGRLLADSRPPDMSSGAGAGASGGGANGREPWLLQHFLGWSVRTEQGVFSPETATLMAFRDHGVGAPGTSDPGVHFVYVLPYSRHEALVEDTFFSAVRLPDETYRENLRDFLRERGAGAVTILDEERGVIPMTTAAFDTGASRGVRKIGLAGGAARPSTGYAFWRIQREAAYLAKSLAEDPSRFPSPPSSAFAGAFSRGAPSRMPSASLTRELDRVFLSLLARRPEVGPGLFLSLFRKAPPASVVRFLSDEPTAADYLHIMRALPSTPLVREALRTYVSRAILPRP